MGGDVGLDPVLQKYKALTIELGTNFKESQIRVDQRPGDAVTILDLWPH